MEGAIPRVAPDWDPTDRTLSPAEGFLLSRIDGHTPWCQLRQIAGLPPEEVDACLERWVAQGVVIVTQASDMSSDDAEEEKEDVPTGEACLEPGIDLPEEFQRRVLDVEGQLDQVGYHELLGVGRDADTREIKRAYFRLSKEFHPDRYYRRELGGFRVRLENIFKRVVEAYELLSDPTTRAEIERSMPPPEPEPAPEPEVEPGTPPPPPVELTPRQRKRQMLERLRKSFKIPEQVLAERRIRARQLFESAMLAGKKGQWLEAGAGIRLAIAFDPWNPDYKGGFALVQAQVHQIRAAELLQKADECWDDESRQEAMRMLEEALSYRPGDPEINGKAARLAIELGDLERAREYAEAACELAPESAEHHLTLGRVLRKEGLADKAKQAYQTALKLDPGNELAVASLENLRKRSHRRRGGKR